MKAKDIEDVMQLWLYTNLKAHAFIPEYYWYENFNEVKSALSEAEIYVADQNKKVIGSSVLSITILQEFSFPNTCNCTV